LPYSASAVGQAIDGIELPQQAAALERDLVQLANLGEQIVHRRLAGQREPVDVRGDIGVCQRFDAGRLRQRELQPVVERRPRLVLEHALDQVVGEALCILWRRSSTSGPMLNGRSGVSSKNIARSMTDSLGMGVSRFSGILKSRRQVAIRFPAIGVE
jgi:hypothetical protein